MKIVKWQRVSVRIFVVLGVCVSNLVKPAVAQDLVPFKLILPPNPQSSWGIAAIVPTRTSSTPRQLAGLARFAQDQLKRNNKKWRRFSIFVFNDEKTANKLAELRTPSGNKTINRNNASAIKPYWKQVPVYYEYRNGKGYIFYPQKNPTASWNALLK